MAFNQDQFDIITSLAKSYGATKLVLFGSAQESPETARDIDLACDGVSGWKLYELTARLENVFNMPLDLRLLPLRGSRRWSNGMADDSYEHFHIA